MYQKPGEAERIVVQNDPPHIANNLGQAAANDDAHVRPRPPLETHDEVEEQGEGEECEEGDVGDGGGAVLVDAVDGVAVIATWGEGAVGVGAVGDEVTERRGGFWFVHGERVMKRIL